MQMITGVLQFPVSERAFYPAHSIGFPHFRYVHETLLPVTGLPAVMGIGMIGAGL